MNLKDTLVAATMLTLGAAATPSMAAEPTLQSILSNVETGTWSEISFSDLYSSNWNKAGTVLDFSLTAEYTSWASKQRFSILDGNTNEVIFQGAATKDATKSYILDDALNNYTFSAESGKFSKNFSKVLISASGKSYAFAHEDWTDGDYNDFVVTLKVTAVPEPEAYAMMLAGLGVVGFAARKKKAA